VFPKRAYCIGLSPQDNRFDALDRPSDAKSEFKRLARNRHPPSSHSRRNGVASDSSRKVVLIAIATNFVIAVCKFVAALISGSSAMLAEAFHSTADTGNEILLWIGIKRSARGPDALHPFGHGKVLYFWSLIVAVFIFGVGGTLGFYEGVSRILKPEEVGSSGWSFAVLAVSFVMDFYSWNISKKELVARKKPEESMWEVIRRSKDPTVFTVFLEDSAGMVGSVLAFIGILLARTLHNPYFDAVSSMLIGLLVGTLGLFLARESGALLVGESASQGKIEKIRNIIDSDQLVDKVGDILTMQLSPDQVLVAVAIRFHHGPNVRELEEAIERLERRIQSEEPSVKRIFIEAESLRDQKQRGEDSKAA
jgi:cation diffusion facilitator family transporter